MPRSVVVMTLATTLGGCAQLLGVDDVSWTGSDGAWMDVALDQDAAINDVVLEIEAAPGCDGPCKPTTLVTQAGLAPSLATDGAFVFFRTADMVLSCPTTGCTAPAAVHSTSTSGLHAVAASSNLVVWNDGTTVMGCAPGACGAPATYVDFVPKPVTGIAASPTSSFVLASGGDATILMVHRITTDTSMTDTTVFSGSPGGGAPGPVAAAPKSSHVYWSQVGTPTLYDCPQATCGSSPADVQQIPSPNAIVATGVSAFVATPSALVRTPANLAGTSTFVNAAITGVALSPNSTARVYFASGMSIQSCSTTEPTPCAPATHYTGGSPIAAIAAADDALYWIEGTSIMRLAL